MTELTSFVTNSACFIELSGKLLIAGNNPENVPYQLAIAAADDPLALYHEASRLIEKKVGAEKGQKGKTPEGQALFLSRDVARLLTA